MERLDPAPTLCASNLPYSVAGPFVAEALQRLPGVRRYCLMVQREVAERMAAAPGTKTYGTLSVWVGLYTRLVRTRQLSRTIFHPQPHVDSTLVVLERLEQDALPAIDAALLRQVVQAAFGQRRKTLVNALCAGLEVPRTWAVDMVGSLGLSADVRQSASDRHSSSSSRSSFGAGETQELTLCGIVRWNTVEGGTA
jgi:16S rRNA A1518/A1519 N6-dimethyltransferase RsmA/KsgA/DIM1 with predicted DNA glycosylase/AP lyase activity